MSGTPLEIKLRTQAAAFSELTALLGTTPFRWYDVQIAQGTAFPAIAVQVVFDGDTYVFAGRLATGFTRVQFDIWDTDPVRLRQVEGALTDFMNVFNGTGIQGLVAYGNFFVMRRQGLTPNPTRPPYRRICDVNIFSSDLI